VSQCYVDWNICESFFFYIRLIIHFVLYYFYPCEDISHLKYAMNSHFRAYAYARIHAHEMER
jgi:hypothetical protein